MDESKLKAWVVDNLQPTMDALGLPHWRVSARLDALDDPLRGHVDVAAAYERATITIDPARVDDDRVANDVLQHELIHCILAPFDLVISAAIEYVADDRVRAMMTSIHKYACEQAVRNVERLLYQQEKMRERAATPAGTTGDDDE